MPIAIRLVIENGTANVKVWIAIISAIAALIVAIINHFSTRSNQRAIEGMRDAQKDRDAKRDYEYEARKRLYHDCGPILFQLTELSESAYHRIRGLAAAARDGNLRVGPDSFLRDKYFLLSTLYRFLAPSAALKVLQRRLTSVDLSLDSAIQRQYILARQVFFALGAEFTFAKLSDVPLRYEPFDKNADEKARSAPDVYWRQGLPIGVMEVAIEVLLSAEEQGAARVMTYAECEAANSKKESRVHKEFQEISFLFEDFHPRTRPVLWRMLVTQACLYRVLSQPIELVKNPWDIRVLRIPDSERSAFDWRSDGDKDIPDSEIWQPFVTAEKYFVEKLNPSLERLAKRG
jgi:hypothetical protein